MHLGALSGVTNEEHPLNRQMTSPWARLVAAMLVVVFVLALRDEFAAIWGRMLLASLAFGIFGLVWAHIRQRRSE